nr:hypothetical protein [uncultured Kingella sp.]
MANSFGLWEQQNYTRLGSLKTGNAVGVIKKHVWWAAKRVFGFQAA